MKLLNILRSVHAKLLILQALQTATEAEAAIDITEDIILGLKDIAGGSYNKQQQQDIAQELLTKAGVQ